MKGKGMQTTYWLKGYRVYFNITALHYNIKIMNHALLKDKVCPDFGPDYV